MIEPDWGVIRFSVCSGSISLNGGRYMSFAPTLVFSFASVFISTVAMSMEPSIPPCLTQPAPPDANRIKNIHGVLGVVVNSNNKNLISAFVDNGDVVRLETHGCNNGIATARLWMGNVGYVINSADMNGIAVLEKTLIQRARIVTRMVFQDQNEIARVDELMDSGYFLPQDKNGFKEFSGRTHDFGMEIQQVTGGPSEALISIYYFNSPLVKK
jgi:hypothetical protein